jgi:tRNA(Ile)-lysidine synthase
VVRPLLTVSRATIEAELARRGLTPLRDASNTDPAYARNRLRHHLVPAWQALDPGIAARLARTADLLAEEDAYLEAETERVWQQAAHIADTGRADETAVALDRALFLCQPLALRRRLLRRAATLQSSAPTLAAIDRALAIAGGPAGGMASLATGSTLFVGAERLWIGARPEAPLGPWMVSEACLPLNLDGTTLLPGAPWLITCRRVTGAACDAPLSGRHAHFALMLGDLAPLLRTWRRGDRIALPGVAGRTKLSDVFTDRKVPRHERATAPLVAAGETVAWIVGSAVGEPHRAHGHEPVVFCCQALPV